MLLFVVFVAGVLFGGSGVVLLSPTKRSLASSSWKPPHIHDGAVIKSFTYKDAFESVAIVQVRGGGTVKFVGGITWTDSLGNYWYQHDSELVAELTRRFNVADVAKTC